ncbi:class I SAM-dependent methyltransferase [Actinospica sp.]|uniref:class I SAM-dependent methyltransferase n=1 Tax=Actinospica sp. TaxID=1872142 RepID=UPI002C2DDC1A|nr:class I SAM-dependent methyltransferase [Actinospica sp.]HWG23451.1 class I SAM-dependent methyltransferase [Actinospica sp.]
MADEPLASSRHWNHNVAYHGVVRRAVPSGGVDLLDVGCGRGRLARALALSDSRRHVIGLDPSGEMVDAARAAHEDVPGLEFVEGDFLACEIPADSLDFVCFVASLHHMDQARALAKAAEILRPGGRLLVIGQARATTLPEQLVSALCAPVVWFNDLRPDFAPGDFPTVEPLLGWRETARMARGTLPEAHFRRRLYYRYSLRWTKPRTKPSG